MVHLCLKTVKKNIKFICYLKLKRINRTKKNDKNFFFIFNLRRMRSQPKQFYREIFLLYVEFV